MAQLQETTVDGNVFVTGEVIETGNQPVSGTIDLASSDELPEGSSNLYFTTERAQDAAAQMLTAGVSPGTGITATYSDNVDEFEFSVDLGPFSTDDLSEGGSNLYYTDSRVNDAITAGSGLQKSFSGGVVTLDHDVSAASSTNNSGSDYIQNITLDSDGHVTAVSSDTVPEFSFSIGESTTSLFTVESGHAITINEVAGSSLTVTGSEPVMFGGSIKQFEIDHNVSAASDTANSGNDYIQNLTFDDNGHVTAVTSTSVPQLDSTDDLSEGSSNLYYTDDRARGAVSASGDLNYNATTGEFSVTTYKSSDFDTDFSGKTTDDLTEGSNNEYFTSARAVSAIESATLTSLDVDNVQLNGNTISTTNTDGDLVIQPNGTGIVEVYTDIIPDQDNVRTLGTPSLQWKDVYIGPGSLFVNGKKVIEDQSGTINVTTDQDQNLSIRTKGTGNLEFVTDGPNIQVKANLEIADGSNILSANGDLIFDDSIGFTSGNGIDASDIILGTIPASVIDSSSISNVTGTPNATFAVDSDAASHVLLKNNAGTLEIRNQDDNNDADLVVRDLTVNGTTTTVNSESVSLADNTLELNSDASGTPSEDAGIVVNRGSVTNASLTFDESSDVWKAGLFGSETEIALVGANLSEFTNDSGFITDISGFDTDNLTEGASNLYYTDTRARNALSAADDLSYNATIGEFSVTTYKSADFDTDFGGKDTDDLTEGTTNLYFTNTRARNALSASGDLSYNSGTGTFSVATYKSSDFDTDFGTKSTSDLSEGTNLYFTNERVDDRVNNLLSAGSNVSLSYDDSADTLTINSTDTTYVGGNAISVSNQTIDFLGLGLFDTDQLPEGNSNLYFTDARAVSAVDGSTITSFTTEQITLTDPYNSVDDYYLFNNAAGLGFYDTVGASFIFEYDHSNDVWGFKNGNGLVVSSLVRIATTDGGVSATLSVDGNAAIGSTSFAASTAPTDGLAVEGNLAIGQSSASTALDVNGDITIPEGLIGSNAVGDKTISTSQPSGGSDGDVWYVVS